MTERERLIELLKNVPRNTRAFYDQFADYLLENGVIVLPVKIGDKVYRISTRAGTKLKYIQETTISRIAIDNEGIWLFCTCNPIAKCVFGKTVFLTKEEATKELKE